MAGKAIIVLVAAFGLSFAYYSSMRHQGAFETESRVADHQYQMLARQAAKNGLFRARQEMAAGMAQPVVMGEYGEGTYNANVSLSGNYATILSEGRMPNTRDQAVSWKIKAVFEATGSNLPPIAPTFMRYALITDEDLTLGGNPDVDLEAEALVGRNTNANIHTNGDLTINGDNVYVAGFGTYVGSANANPERALTTTFTPPANPGDLDGLQAIGEIPIPELNIQETLANVSVDTESNKSVELTGTLQGGSREDPLVWYIPNGGLTITGDVQIDGYVMFIVDGDINISGNVRTTSGWSEGEESSLVLYATGNVDINGSVKVAAQIFANGGFRTTGTPAILGSVTTRGVVEMKGTPGFYYRDPSPALTKPWHSNQADSYRLISYVEFLETRDGYQRIPNSDVPTR
jgi:hypothetical protein